MNHDNHLLKILEDALKTTSYTINKVTEKEITIGMQTNNSSITLSRQEFLPVVEKYMEYLKHVKHFNAETLGKNLTMTLALAFAIRDDLTKPVEPDKVAKEKKQSLLFPLLMKEDK